MTSTSIGVISLSAVIFLGCAPVNDIRDARTTPEKPAGDPPIAKTPEQAAQGGLVYFVEGIGSERPDDLGFKSTDELRRAQLGTAYSISWLRLDDVKRLPQNAPLAPVLRSSDQKFFPVEVKTGTNTAVVSSLWVREKPNGWQATRFGGGELAQALDQTRAREMARTGKPASDFFLVHIDEVTLFMLGRKDQQDLELTPLADVVELGIKTSNREISSAMLRRLASLSAQWPVAAP